MSAVDFVNIYMEYIRGYEGAFSFKPDGGVVHSPEAMAKMVEFVKMFDCMIRLETNTPMNKAATGDDPADHQPAGTRALILWAPAYVTYLNACRKVKQTPQLPR